MPPSPQRSERTPQGTPPPDGAAARSGTGPRARRVSLPALLAVVVYVVIATATHHVWPFYVFDMYAFAAPGTSSRISLIDEAGHTRDVRDVRAIRCPPETRAALDGPTCNAWWTVVARDDEVWEVLRTRALAGPGEPATLVRRGWRWGAPADADEDAERAPRAPRPAHDPPEATDCARVRCEVRW